MTAADELPSAASISVHVCEHGTLTLRLHDNTGGIFAVASMETTVALDLMEDMEAKLTAFANSQGIGPCEGHA